jgi:UPF0755 protein
VTSRPHGDTESDIPDWVNGEEDWPEEIEEAWPEEPVGAHAAERRRRHQGAHWGRRALVAAAVLLLVLVAVGVGLFVWVDRHLNGAGGAAVAVSLPGQAGHAQLASTLVHDGVVSDAWLFRHYLDYRNTPPAQAGRYTFHRHEGYRAALHDLEAGPAIVQVRLTIPEGYGLDQIAASVAKLPGLHLSAQRFLSLASTGAVRSRYEPTGSNNLEGLMFPDTYFIDQGEDEQQILQTLVDRFDQVADQLSLASSPTTNGLTPYQTVVLASLVEREAKVEADRGKIARVIVNRLAQHTKLQIDATVEYAEGVHKPKLLDSDLRFPSPYNTYLNYGLPPGPIASPGGASLQAALNPTPGTWLYYVLINPDGEHGFATTQQEFNRLLAESTAKGLR